jgi:cyclophilin family peptidyl-prolyl cis-trans isomerase
MTKSVFAALGMPFIVSGAFAAATLAPTNTPASALAPGKAAAPVAKPAAGPKKAVVETSLGTFTFVFLADKAPKTCDNFIALAEKGFYNGLTFHRVIPNFMIQGGCPKGNGTGDAGYKVKAEFNDTKHVPGIVSMARSAHPDSAGSQFFVCVATCPWLDRQYTAFGKVTDGQDVVDKISKVPTLPGDRPQTPVQIKKVTISQ